ncbi:hypothetical protein C0995_002015 [Termitomyces sp. Mi166|nr:hypothetical protein C0995_002015 [Termitomyces sp. Mi166\
MKVLTVDPTKALADKRNEGRARIYKLDVLLLWCSRITEAPEAPTTERADKWSSVN